MNATHLFECQGFGPGPYLLIGHNQAAGTCDSCGQGIKDVYTLRSASGAEFNVGSECAGDKHDPALKAINRIRTKATKARAEKRIEKLFERLADDDGLRELLASRPHPKKWFREQGMSMLNSVEWMMKNSGHNGRIKTVRLVEKLEKELG